MPPGPHNPLGSHALYFDWPTYLIHGTNRPWGIGRRVSHGCIRLYPEDIARLYELVPIGTPVQVINQAIKIGWYEGELYVEAHPESGQADELESTGQIKSVDARSRADALYRITSSGRCRPGPPGLAPHPKGLRGTVGYPCPCDPGPNRALCLKAPIGRRAMAARQDYLRIPFWKMRSALSAAACAASAAS